MADIIAQTPDGSEFHFPDGTPPEVIKRAIQKHVQTVMAPPPPVDQRAKNAAAVQPVGGGLNQSTPSNYLMGNPKTAEEGGNNAIEILRNILPPAAGTAAGVAATPTTGGFGSAAASIGAYTGIDTLLKQLKFGNKQTIPDSLKESIIQATLNEAGGRIISGTWKAAKAFNKADQPEILKFLPTASQALKAEGKMPSVAGILKFVEDNFASGSKQAAQEKSAQEGSKLGFKQAAKIAGRSPETVRDPNTMAKLATGELVPEKTIVGGTNKIAPYATDPASLDKLLADPVRLQSALTKSQAAGAGINARQDLAAYRLARLQQNATTMGPDGAVRIDPMQIAIALNDPEMLATNKLLFNSKQLSNVQQFYKNVAATQEKSGGFGQYRKLRFTLEGMALAGGLGRALITGNVLPVATYGAPVAVELGLAGVAKLLTSPKTARLMLALANDEALGVSEQYAARIMMQNLANATGNLINEDGSKTPFEVRKGQMVPLQE